jgi:hypothetical protein
MCDETHRKQKLKSKYYIFFSNKEVLPLLNLTLKTVRVLNLFTIQQQVIEILILLLSNLIKM